MASRLQDDLIQDFREQKELIYQQIGIFDPLGTQLRKPAARRLVSKGALIIAEILCYLLAMAAVAFAVFMHKIHPFYILQEINTRREYAALGKGSTELLNISFYGMVAVIALLMIIVARCVRTIRLKNDILNFAGKHINTLVGQHLKRKANIEMLEQRHRGELPIMPHTAISDYESITVNTMPNPGYDGQQL